MASKKKQLFEADRRMELRLRLAVKRYVQPSMEPALAAPISPLPERETVDRLIEKVRRL